MRVIRYFVSSVSSSHYHDVRQNACAWVGVYQCSIDTYPLDLSTHEYRWLRDLMDRGKKLPCIFYESWLLIWKLYNMRNVYMLPSDIRSALTSKRAFSVLAFSGESLKWEHMTRMVGIGTHINNAQKTLAELNENKPEKTNKASSCWLASFFSLGRFYNSIGEGNERVYMCLNWFSTISRMNLHAFTMFSSNLNKTNKKKNTEKHSPTFDNNRIKTNKQKYTNENAHHYLFNGSSESWKFRLEVKKKNK